MMNLAQVEHTERYRALAGATGGSFLAVDSFDETHASGTQTHTLGGRGASLPLYPCSLCAL